MLILVFGIILKTTYELNLMKIWHSCWLCLRPIRPRPTELIAVLYLAVSKACIGHQEMNLPILGPSVPAQTTASVEDPQINGAAMSNSRKSSLNKHFNVK